MARSLGRAIQLTFLLVVSLGLPDISLSCAEQPCEPHFLLQDVREVRLAHGGYLREASGLTGFGEYLWTVSDKSDAAIYRLEISRQGTAATLLEVPLDISPTIRQSLRACGSHRGENLDLEDIGADAEGLFFLLSENYRAILIARVEDPNGPGPRVIVRDVLCVPGRNQRPNNGLEGLGVFSGSLLALEEGQGQSTKGLYRCRPLERQCAPVPSPVLAGRTPGLTAFDPYGSRLLVLNTWWGLEERFNKICEVEAGDPNPKGCLLDLDQVTESARGRVDLPESFQRVRAMNYEGIYFDSVKGRLYTINDNNASWNRIFFGDAEREPTLLLIFTPIPPPPPQQ